MVGGVPTRDRVTAGPAAERAGTAAAGPGPELAVLSGPVSAMAPEVVAAHGFTAGWIGAAGAALVADRRAGDRLDDLVAPALALWQEPRLHTGPSDPRPSAPAASPAGAAALWLRLRAGAPGAVEIHVWSGSGERLWAEVRAAAPGWTAPREARAHEVALARLRERVRWLEVLTLDALPPFAEALLSPRERARCERLGARRRRDFAAGRIALKLATRAETTGELAAIDTLAADGVLARSPTGGGGASIAHDCELAIAVACARGVPGVDVERVAPRLESAVELYAGAAERRLAATATVDLLEALGRIWTAKEACAKAWARPLPELFAACELCEIGRDASVARLGGERVEILHASLGAHLVSFVERAS